MGRAYDCFPLRPRAPSSPASSGGPGVVPPCQPASLPWARRSWVSLVGAVTCPSPFLCPSRTAVKTRAKGNWPVSIQALPLKSQCPMLGGIQKDIPGWSHAWNVPPLAYANGHCKPEVAPDTKVPLLRKGTLPCSQDDGCGASQSGNAPPPYPQWMLTAGGVFTPGPCFKPGACLRCEKRRDPRMPGFMKTTGQYSARARAHVCVCVCV